MTAMELDPTYVYERTIRRLDRLEQIEKRQALIGTRDLLEDVVGALLIAEDVLIEIADNDPASSVSIFCELTLTVLKKITDGEL